MVFKIGIVEPRDFSDKALTRLKEIGEVAFFNEQQGDLEAFIRDKHCIFVRLKYFISEKILLNAKELKYICTPTTGLNHIDSEFTEKANIKIISLRGETEFLSTITATPEHTIGLAIALLRNYNRAFIRASNMQWNRDLFKGYELNGMTTGIIGFGRVGNLLCKYLKAFNAQVYYFDIKESVINEHGALKTDSIETLIRMSELIFLCASYSPQNERMLSKEYLDMMNNKFFVNTSRGELIDEKYMIECLNRDHFSGVALDVITNETGCNNSKQLAEMVERCNLIVTPHVAGATYNSMWKTECYIVEKLMGELK